MTIFDAYLKKPHSFWRLIYHYRQKKIYIVCGCHLICRWCQNCWETVRNLTTYQTHRIINVITTECCKVCNFYICCWHNFLVIYIQRLQRSAFLIRILQMKNTQDLVLKSVAKYFFLRVGKEFLMFSSIFRITLSEIDDMVTPRKPRHR